MFFDRQHKQTTEKTESSKYNTHCMYMYGCSKPFGVRLNVRFLTNFILNTQLIRWTCLAIGFFVVILV